MILERSSHQPGSAAAADLDEADRSLRNAMGARNVLATDVGTLGPRMAAFTAVTHCHRRPTYPDWPYNLFTMVHGRMVAECDMVLTAISRETGVADYRALYSGRELKKVPLAILHRRDRELGAAEPGLSATGT